MSPGVLGQVVAAGETLGTQGAGEPLLACVRPVVAGQLIRSGELLVTARPVTGKGPLTWTRKRPWSVSKGRGADFLQTPRLQKFSHRSGPNQHSMSPCFHLLH